MTFLPDQIAALSADLNKAHVKERTQAGRSLSYVEAWHAIAEANRIFGFDAWTRETVMLTETNRELVELRGQSGPYQQWRVGYLAKVRVTAGGVVREGTGFGSGMAKPEAIGEAIESAAKEAESDAMKRALMTFGNPFGLALYDKTQANVSSDPAPSQGGRKSSAAAKRDGDHTRINAEIDGADRALLKDWLDNFDAKTASLPFGWLDALRDRIQLRLEELNGADAVREASEELDAGFRGTLAGSDPAGMAGRAHHHPNKS